MDRAIQAAKAETFRKLHDRSKLLLLPNAWDVASARIYEAAGFRAIATTSAGVAWAMGYPDGQLIPRDDARSRAPNHRVRVRAGHRRHGGRIRAGAGGRGRNGAWRDCRGGRRSQPRGRHRRSRRSPRRYLTARRENPRRACRRDSGGRPGRHQRPHRRLSGCSRRTETLDSITRFAGPTPTGKQVPIVCSSRASRIRRRSPRWSGRSPVRLTSWPVPARLLSRSSPGLEWRALSVGSGPMLAVLGRLRRIANELMATGTFTAMTEDAVSYAEMNDLLKLPFVP